MRRRTPTIAAAWVSSWVRPSEGSIVSHSGMNARDDSASPLRIASRIQGSDASLARSQPRSRAWSAVGSPSEAYLRKAE